jgi:hypothetical protein
MNKSSLILVASSVLLISLICGFSLVNAVVVYDIFPFPQSSTTINLHQSIKLLAQVGYVESNGVPPADFVWYVNGALAKSERSASSTFIFFANAVGTYHITATVNGHSNSQVINVTVIGESTPTPTLSPPNITSLSLENKTYITNNLSLNFTLSKPAQWIGYSLDGQSNVTINENTTLTGLPNGQHTVNIYANDTNGNFAPTQTLNFTIDKPTPFPILTVITVVASAIAIAIIVVLLFLLNRKHRKTTNSLS